MGYPTPDTLPAETICRQLSLPNDPVFVAAFTGALLALTDAAAWEAYGAVTPDEAAAAAFSVFNAYLSEECRGAEMLGTIVAYITLNAPDGVLPCDGATYQRADYPDLYDLLDAAYIIDANSFRVPDLRGRAVIGTGQGAGLSNRALNDSGGAETHILTEAQMPSHNHSYNYRSTTRTGSGSGGVWDGTTSANTGSKGGNQAHNNMQPWRALHYGIVAL